MVEWTRVEEVEYRESRERERERERVTEKLHMCRYVVQFLTCTIPGVYKVPCGTNKPLEF